MDFAHRHVVVTGGTGALGRAVVEELLDRGAICHVAARRAPADWPHDTEVAILDLADEEAVTAFYRSLPELWASLHVAGGFAMAPIAETTAADLERMWSMNARTCFLCCREAVRAMRGGGRIVNVAARPALVPAGGAVAYAAAKSAVAGLTTCLAEEVVGEGILVNAVVPGILDTPANRAAMPDADRSGWAPLDAVAKAMAFLASPDNAVIRGTLVRIWDRLS